MTQELAPRPELDEVPDGDALREALFELTVKELRAEAKARDIGLQGARRKADLVDRIVEVIGPSVREPEAPADLEVGTHALSFGRLEDLWMEAANRLDSADYRAAMALSRDALNFLGEWTEAYRKEMVTLALQAARNFLRRYVNPEDVKGPEAKLQAAIRAYGDEDYDAVAALIEDLHDRVTDVYLEEAGRVREILEEKTAELRKLETMGVEGEALRNLLREAEYASRLDQHARALDLLHRFDQVAERTREDRLTQLRARLGSLEGKLGDARGLGASVDDAAKLLEQALDAMEREDLVLATQLARQCEEGIVRAQKVQIEWALRLRKQYFEQVKDTVSYLKPILREADAYGLDTQRPRELIRTALGLLRQEDYFSALERSQEARDALEALLPEVVDARKERGVEEPTEAICSRCGSAELTFQEDGWSTCGACGDRSVWTGREPRLLGFLKKLTP